VNQSESESEDEDEDESKSEADIRWELCTYYELTISKLEYSQKLKAAAMCILN
jgi:hypothetical protein